MAWPVFRQLLTARHRDGLTIPVHPGGKRRSDPLIASVRERFGRLIHEVAKFGVVGGVGFIVTVAGFNLLHYNARLGSFTAYTIAIVAATAVTYVGNKFWTFRHRDGRGTTRDSVLFFVLNVIGMGIQYIPVGVTDHLLHLADQLSNNIALVIGVAFGTLFRFWSYRQWVWGSPAAAAAAAVAPAPAPAPAPAVLPARPSYADATATRQAGGR